jgi:hypothetical protein
MSHDKMTNTLRIWPDTAEDGMVIGQVIEQFRHSMAVVAVENKTTLVLDLATYAEKGTRQDIQRDAFFTKAQVDAFRARRIKWIASLKTNRTKAAKGKPKLPTGYAYYWYPRFSSQQLFRIAGNFEAISSVWRGGDNWSATDNDWLGVAACSIRNESYITGATEAQIRVNKGVFQTV